MTGDLFHTHPDLIALDRPRCVTCGAPISLRHIPGLLVWVHARGHRPVDRHAACLVPLPATDTLTEELCAHGRKVGRAWVAGDSATVADELDILRALGRVLRATARPAVTR